MFMYFKRVILGVGCFLYILDGFASFKSQVAYGGSQGIHVIDATTNDLNKNLLKAKMLHKGYEDVTLDAVADMFADIMKDESDEAERILYKEAVGQIIAYLKAARDDLPAIEKVFEGKGFKISTKVKAGFSGPSKGKHHYSHHGLDLYNMLQLVVHIYNKLDAEQRQTFRLLGFALIKDNISLKGGCYPGHYNRLTQLVNIFM